MGIFDIFRKDKEKPDFSNVESGSSSTAPEPQPEFEEEYVSQGPERVEQPEPLVHTVERGDTLWGIAERYLGEGRRWREIHKANDELIDDPDRIQPGMEIVIPGMSQPGGIV